MIRFPSLACGVLAVALSAVGIWSAWDFGGGNYNTHLAAAITVLALLPLGLLVTIANRGVGASALLWLAAVTCALAFLQTVPLAPSWINRLSPGTATAYQTWLPEALLAEAAANESLASLPAVRGQVPVSVAATHTRMALALPALFGLTVWLGGLSISRRQWGVLFLAATAIAGGVFGFFGLADTIRLSRDQDVELRQRLIISPVGADKPFGPFVNSNNGAGYTNLALGCAVALLTLALRRSPSPLQAISWQTIGCGLLIALLFAAVLGSESRGAFLGTLAGAGGVGLSMLRGRKRLWGLLGGLVVLALAVWMLDALGMRQQTADRLQTLVNEQAREDPRLDHWSDSLQAAARYLPAGSGLGTYAFAYLPYQQLGGGGWFLNADGMPIEWLLEGGLWLLPLVLAGIVMLVRELIYLASQRHRLPAADAAYAHALLTGLTFILPSMLVSQCFDFGILLPPLLLTTAAVCGGAIGLAARLRSMTAPVAAAPRFRLPAWSIGLIQITAMLTMIASLVTAAGDLRDGSTVQQMRLTREALIRRSATALPDYTADIQQLRAIVDRRPQDSEAHTMLANLLLDDQRRRGATFLVQQQLATAEQATRMVSPRNVRKAFYQQSPPGSLGIEDLLLPSQDLNAWREARQHALGSLLLNPLDDRPRYLLIELDMLHPAADAATADLLQQCQTLRSRNDSMLRQIQALKQVHGGGRGGVGEWGSGGVKE